MSTSSTAMTMLDALERLGDPDASEGPDLRAAFDEATTDANADDVLATAPPTVHAAVARVCLLTAAGRDEEVLALTHGVVAVDDLSAVLVCCRATALARVGMTAGADDAWKVLNGRHRHADVRALARHQRDTTAPPARPVGA
ncbi:MAG TPA: hypothetical protein VFZ70_07305 [Euzebyales bacterium]